MDELSDEIFLKSDPEKRPNVVLMIFNLTPKACDIPESWCRGLITAVRKKGHKLNQMIIKVFVSQMLF